MSSGAVSACRVYIRLASARVAVTARAPYRCQVQSAAAPPLPAELPAGLQSVALAPAAKSARGMSTGFGEAMGRGGGGGGGSGGGA